MQHYLTIGVLYIRNKKTVSMKNDIEELNKQIINARFLSDRPETKADVMIGKGLNEELFATIKRHRKEFGICSKIQVLRNYIRTRPFIRTTLFKEA